MFSNPTQQPTANATRHRTTLAALLCVLLLAGCAGDKEKIVQEKVAEKVADFRKKKNMECRQSLFAKAEQIVDSLLLSEAESALQDSLSRLRPFRPTQPPAVPPIDSNAVKPIFDKLPKQ